MALLRQCLFEVRRRHIAGEWAPDHLDAGWKDDVLARDAIAFERLPAASDSIEPAARRRPRVIFAIQGSGR